jgi:hypothetical protein
MHAVSLTPHAFLEIRITSRILIYIRKGFSPLIRGPGRTIRAALAGLLAFKGNIFQKLLCSRIVLPQQYKNIEIERGYRNKKKFVHAVSLTPNA